MTQPIALQLYTVRDQLAHDFEGTIRRVADIGLSLIHILPVWLPLNDPSRRQRML